MLIIQGHEESVTHKRGDGLFVPTILKRRPLTISKASSYKVNLMSIHQYTKNLTHGFKTRQYRQQTTLHYCSSCFASITCTMKEI